jgi:predicted house-cleaning NTP pyrophosphatase (Maf/HAM1 superfamily)
MGPLILASASPRRRDLLARDGYEFTVVPADVVEISPSDLTPAELTLYNARLKARAVAEAHPETLVLGVDTVVAFDGEVFGKPRDMDEALSMVTRMSGRVHEVWSGGWPSPSFALISRASVRSTKPARMPRRTTEANSSSKSRDASTMWSDCR